MGRTALWHNRRLRPLRNGPPQRPRGGNAASGYALRSVPTSHNQADNSFATTPDSSICCQHAYLRQLKAQGAILGGKCWADPDLNSPQSIQDGKIYFNFDFTPPYPAEHIIFRSHLVDDYLEEIL